MKTILRVPKLAVSMQTGVLTAWLAQDGERVDQGQPLYTLEIEKSVMDVQAPATGVLKRIGVENETYKVGEILGEIERRVAVQGANTPIKHSRRACFSPCCAIFQFHQSPPQPCRRRGAGPCREGSP